MVLKNVDLPKKMKKRVDNSPSIAYNNFRTACDGELCNGSTYDSDSYCLGSNPSSPARLHGQAVKTSPSQGEIRGSIPLGATKVRCEEQRTFCLPAKTPALNGGFKKRITLGPLP